MSHEKNPWSVLSSKKIYENPWISLTEYQVLNAAGKPGIYGAVHFRNLAIGIIALDEQQRIWLVGQYRFTLDQYSWEIPEGGCPEGSDPLQSARRELQEETGLSAMRWQEIQRIHLSNSVSDELGILYLATGLTAGEAEPEETEVLQTRKVPLEEAYRMVCSGLITDSLSVAGILKVRLMAMEGKLET